MNERTLRPAPMWTGWRDRAVMLSAAFGLAVLYASRYLNFQDRPGKRADFLVGWWSWWDQSKYLQSAHALAHGDFSPAHHWYPLGYSALGALFERLAPVHPFFLIDLASLLLTYWAFVAFSRRVGVRTLLATLIFAFCVAADRKLFGEWIIPWNMTPAIAVLWALLAVTAAHMDGVRRPLLIGLLAGLVPVFRPTEIVLAAPCVLAALAVDMRTPSRLGRQVPMLAAGFALPAALYVLLHLRIYGPHFTDYMLYSRDLGFTLHDLGWKAYVVMVDPGTWFLGGEGLLRRSPWIVLAIAGAAPALLHGGKKALLVVMVLIHSLVYLSYLDLLPSGFWRFNTVHYWIWALPAYGLLAWLLLKDLFVPATPARRAVAGVSLAATLLVLCLQIVPVPATGAADKARDLAGPQLAAFETSYFSDWWVRDAQGLLRNTYDMRVVPTPGGLRLLALRRPFVGSVAWVPGHGPAETFGIEHPLRWDMAVRLGRPCWIKQVGCPLPPPDRMFRPRTPAR